MHRAAATVKAFVFRSEIRDRGRPWLAEGLDRDHSPRRGGFDELHQAAQIGHRLLPREGGM